MVRSQPGYKVILRQLLSGQVLAAFTALFIMGGRSSAEAESAFNPSSVVGFTSSSESLTLDNQAITPFQPGSSRRTVRVAQADIPRAATTEGRGIAGSEAPSVLWLIVMPAIPIAGAGLIYTKRRWFSAQEQTLCDSQPHRDD
jgi:hypothetical protein